MITVPTTPLVALAVLPLIGEAPAGLWAPITIGGAGNHHSIHCYELKSKLGQLVQGTAVWECSAWSPSDKLREPT
jgi:hypothetical protein